MDLNPRIIDHKTLENDHLRFVDQSSFKKEPNDLLNIKNWNLVTDVEVLIDAENYFKAFVEEAEQAKKRIVIVGWDVDSRTPLLKKPLVTLKEFLKKLTKINKDLEIKILCWDYSIFVSSDREWGPWLFGGTWGERIEFVMDHHHPLFSCHHQKIVLIDDQVAFIGGIDLCENRWDSRDHLVDNPLRVNSSKNCYKPFHDLQVKVRGPAIQKIVREVKSRWFKATGKFLTNIKLETTTTTTTTTMTITKPPSELVTTTHAEIHWQALLGQVTLTRPPFFKQKSVKENLKITLDLIREAKNHIYIENQYLTHRRIVKALGHKLKNSSVEITIVLPKKSYNWLEGKTIYWVQQRAIQRLRKYDIHGRLKIVYPRIQKENKVLLYVHSKVIFVDDKYFKIGSTNLNHRSMGMDTECDLVFQSFLKKHDFKRLRLTLLSEHLNTTYEYLNFLNVQGLSTHQLIEKFQLQERSLQEFPEKKSVYSRFWSVEPVFDRSRPIKFNWSWYKLIFKFVRFKIIDTARKSA